VPEGSNHTGPLVPADGVAVVTGASRGIGRAVALCLATDGRPLALLARTEQALRDVAAEAERLGTAAIPIPCDVADQHQVTTAVARIHERLGPIRIVVNNAGLFLDRPMWQTTPEQWERVLRVNLTAAFHITQTAWPDMLNAGGGVIVNIASKAGTQGYAGQSAYCASKAGMLGWARAIAIEGRPHNIRVHNICPGGVDTEFIARTPLAQRLDGQVMLHARDIAHVVRFCILQPANVDLPDILMARFSVR
jgi:3-oxoacyl-[acyl-carrier protein] reductase